MSDDMPLIDNRIQKANYWAGDNRASRAPCLLLHTAYDKSLRTASCTSTTKCTSQQRTRCSAMSPFLPRCSCAAALFLRASLRSSVRPSVKRVNCDKTKAPIEKSSIMTKRKSPTSFPISLRWTAYQRGPQKHKVSVFRIKNWAFLEESLPQRFFVWKLSAAVL